MPTAPHLVGEDGRWRKLTREQIAERGDNLDWTWLRDESGDPEDDMTDPGEIAAAIMGHLRAALDEIEALSEEGRCAARATGSIA